MSEKISHAEGLLASFLSHKEPESLGEVVDLHEVANEFGVGRHNCDVNYATTILNHFNVEVQTYNKRDSGIPKKELNKIKRKIGATKYHVMDTLVPCVFKGMNQDILDSRGGSRLERFKVLFNAVYDLQSEAKEVPIRYRLIPLNREENRYLIPDALAKIVFKHRTANLIEATYRKRVLKQ